MEYINPIVETTPDYCYACETAHVVEMYTIYDKAIGLSALLNFRNNIADSIKASIAYARCRNCGKRYLVCWNSDGYPYTVAERINIAHFMGELHDYELKELSEDEIDAVKTSGVSRDK